MSYIHFTSCEEYRHRVIQMGESPSRVFNVGALGVENALRVLREESVDNSWLDDFFTKKYAIVVFHPTTMESVSLENQLHEIIKAMDNNDLNYVIIKSNADSGGLEINSIWDKEANNHSNWRVYYSLPPEKYLLLLSKACFILGNSSSGLIEAPAFGTKTINLGNRQRGRKTSRTVVDCDIAFEDIDKEIKKNLFDGNKSPDYLFGDGFTSSRIVDILLSSLEAKPDLEKKFYDINFEVEE